MNSTNSSNSSIRGFALLLCTFFFWGSLYVASKLLPQDMPGAVVGCLRCAIASCVLLPVAIKQGLPHIDKADYPYFFGVGFAGYFLTIFFVQTGVSMTGAAIGALISSATPVGVTFFAAIMLKEKITPVKLLCLVLAVAGCVVICMDSTGSGELMGMILVACSIVSWGIASVCMRRLTATYSSLAVCALGTAMSVVFHIPTAVFASVTTGSAGITLSSLIVALYLGLIGSALAQYSWTAALEVFPASTCSLFYPLQPITAAVLGALLLGESLKSSFFVGLIIISIGIVLSCREVARQAKNSVDVSSHSV